MLQHDSATQRTSAAGLARRWLASWRARLADSPRVLYCKLYKLRGEVQLSVPSKGSGECKGGTGRVSVTSLSLSFGHTYSILVSEALAASAGASALAPSGPKMLFLNLQGGRRGSSRRWRELMSKLGKFEFWANLR